jgi:hypothetical protein
MEPGEESLLFILHVACHFRSYFVREKEEEEEEEEEDEELKHTGTFNTNYWLFNLTTTF